MQFILKFVSMYSTLLCDVCCVVGHVVRHMRLQSVSMQYRAYMLTLKQLRLVWLNQTNTRTSQKMKPPTEVCGSGIRQGNWARPMAGELSSLGVLPRLWLKGCGPCWCLPGRRECLRGWAPRHLPRAGHPDRGVNYSPLSTNTHGEFNYKVNYLSILTNSNCQFWELTWSILRIEIVVIWELTNNWKLIEN